MPGSMRSSSSRLTTRRCTPYAASAAAARGVVKGDFWSVK
jgi:hypothetical protein